MRRLGPLAYIMAVYFVALGIARAQTPVTTVVGAPVAEDPAKSKDPKVFCPTMAKEQVEIRGQPVTIYELSSSKFLACVPGQPKSEWITRRSRWNSDDEREFQRFLNVMGESKCNTLEKCLKYPESNTLWSEWDTKAAFYADCADFPYFLRAYFSYKRGLPFSFVMSFNPRPLSAEILERQETSRQAIITEFAADPIEQAKKLGEFETLLTDARYTWNGNTPRARYQVPALAGEARSFFTVNRYIRDNISTGTYRMFETPGEVKNDFYPPLIDLGSVRPGTVLYKPAGHAAIVYKIGDDGSIHFIDAHPDNSVSRGQFGRDYGRSNPNMGGGFKNWRPFVLMQNQKDASGQLQWFEARPDQSGRIRHAYHRLLSDLEIQSCVHGNRYWPCNYSDEQYRGNSHSEDGDWKKGKFLIDGREVDYFDYVRFKMSGGKPISPTVAFRTEVTALCEDLKGRRETVQVALNAGIDKKAHPAAYPRNIYGADGEWEEYSSPGRDIRIRARIGNVVSLAKHFLTVTVKNDPTYAYQPERPVTNDVELAAKLSDMKADFLSIYGSVSQNCEIKYTNSSGAEVRLPFEVVLSRVSKMSFDPYLCAERRWGAAHGPELATCAEDPDKAQWYGLTQFLRNRTERDTSEVMGYRLEELRRMDADKKVDNQVIQSPFNLLHLLKGL